MRYGHAPAHVRESAGSAFEAWIKWDAIEPEPTVEYEIHYEPHQIPISRACKLVWNCTDIVPGLMMDQLLEAGLAVTRRTYAACAGRLSKTSSHGPVRRQPDQQQRGGTLLHPPHLPPRIRSHLRPEPRSPRLATLHERSAPRVGKRQARRRIALDEPHHDRHRPRR